MNNIKFPTLQSQCALQSRITLVYFWLTLGNVSYSASNNNKLYQVTQYCHIYTKM